MKVYILMGSPRKSGNTAALLKPFLEELASHGDEYQVVWLYDKKIAPCVACRVCQADWSQFGCQFDDDAQEIFDKIMACDTLVLATPIYSWYCTPPMKAILDRLVYGMNKYYGDKIGPALWAGKRVALITTCGYRPEKGADLFQTGIERYCKHSHLQFIGALSERHLGYQHTFMDDEKEAHARAFARNMIFLEKEL
ncbi:flavodoxin family protein [Clostridium aminobutyricum]|uniref:Flavodoxin family protein n=1 Tax=Clostridium aminobutyricum TaxID=33953 RepID=A0A939D7H3_CLOAM|nr:flavodoxin family protein [Clostridium aminobutyricum]MBN7772507.1 flavodoxin family protein [Clostridium aminobutyricum]